MSKTPAPEPDYSPEEADRLRDDTLRRMLNSPPKPHAEMKLGKPGRKVKAESFEAKPSR